MPSAAQCLEFSALSRASRWERVGNRRTSYGQNCVPMDESNCHFERLARAPGFPSVVSQADRSSRRYSGARIPSAPGGVFPPTRWFLGPILWVFGWEDKDEDLAFVRDTSVSGQFAQQWKLRMMAQGAPLEEIGDSELRRLLAHGKSSGGADVEVGGCCHL